MIRPFRVRGDRELDPLVARIAELADRWALDWIGRSARPRSIGAIGQPSGDPIWSSVWRASDAPARWVAIRLTGGERLAAKLFATTTDRVENAAPRFDLAAEVVGRAVTDLGRRILATPAVVPDESRSKRELDDALSPGSGACEIRVEVADAALHFLLSAGVVDADCLPDGDGPSSPRGGLDPRSHAIRGERVRGQVIIGTAEISLEALGALAVGDAISLDHCLEEPSRVVFSEIGAECMAYLCRQDGHNAVLIEAAGVQVLPPRRTAETSR